MIFEIVGNNEYNEDNITILSMHQLYKWWDFPENKQSVYNREYIHCSDMLIMMN